MSGSSSEPRRASRRPSLPAAALLVCCAFAAQADVLEFARFQLLPGKEPGSYQLNVQLPAPPAGDERVTLPPQCTQTGADLQMLAGGAELAIAFHCTAPFAPGDQLVAPWGEDGGVLTSALEADPAPVMLHGVDGRLSIPLTASSARARALAEIAAEYVRLGITHILEGIDHLAFVLCLCLLTGGTALLLLVTAFTIGHSISLALSYLGVISVPIAPVEATIALSIAFMAREALAVPRAGNRSDAAPHRARLRYMAVVAGFGLLHGLGFASVLGDLGVSPAERVTGLVFFNIGIEFGQLAFVACVSVLVRLARHLRIEVPLRTGALCVTGVLGAYWAWERIASFTIA